MLEHAAVALVIRVEVHLMARTMRPAMRPPLAVLCVVAGMSDAGKTRLHQLPNVADDAVKAAFWRAGKRVDVREEW